MTWSMIKYQKIDFTSRSFGKGNHWKASGGGTEVQGQSPSIESTSPYP